MNFEHCRVCVGLHWNLRNVRHAVLRVNGVVNISECQASKLFGRNGSCCVFACSEEHVLLEHDLMDVQHCRNCSFHRVIWILVSVTSAVRLPSTSALLS